MSGQNMESLLMGGDDSSSGESDDEVNVPMGTATTAASTVAAPAPVAPPPRVVQAPKPAVQQQPQQQSRGKSGTNQMARLKNLYTMSKSTTGTSNPAPQPLHRPPMQQPQRPPQQQMQPKQRQSHPQMQQRPMQQPPGHPSTQQQQQHKRTQLYQQSQQQQQMQSRPQTQQRQPQYAQPPSQQRQPPSQQRQPPSQQRQPQYSQQSQQQPMQSRPQTQQRQSQYPQSSSQQRQQYAQQVQRQRQSQSRSSSSSQQQGQQVDPFAPTPLSQIKQTPHLASKNQHSRRTHPQQQMPSQRTSTQPMSSRTQQIPGASSTSTSASHQEMKRNKEKFLMFTRVLIKYLEQKDPNMHAQAKAIIKDCAERNKRQEPGYESVTLSMKRRLRDLVGDHYWKKANDYLVHFIEQKKRQAGITSNRGGSSGTAAQQARAAMRVKQQQEMEQRRRVEMAQRAAQAKLKKDQAAKQRTGAPSIADVRKGIQDKREQLESTTGTKAKPKKTTAASKASDSKTATKKTVKKTVRRKSTGDASTSSRKGTTSKASTPSTTTTTIVKRVVVEEHPREYQELMELIDHSVQYDWPSIGQLLGSKADLKLSEEEVQLLYGDNPPESLLKKKTTAKAPAKPATGTPEASKVGTPISSQDASPSQVGLNEQDQDEIKPVLDGIKPGWGQTNVVSARAAWARIRLRELKLRKREAASSAPVVADGLLTLPTAQQPQASAPAESSAAAPAAAPAAASTTAPASTTSSTPGPDTEASMAPKPVPIEGSWVNEETAEQDKALALLSEGCQIYLKGVLQKAVQCARQRQNLDGIRLWHQQYTFSKGVSSTMNKNVDKSKKPPLALRLGCDVSRQAAQAQGNAALTVKRMEEALERQSGIPMRVRELNTETLLEATSMGDLSWRPLLKKGVEKADTEAKRSFEVYGGKEAKDPPLGRVPKKAKLMLEDFVMGSELSVEGPYHKAYTASTFISF